LSRAIISAISQSWPDHSSKITVPKAISSNHVVPISTTSSESQDEEINLINAPTNSSSISTISLIEQPTITTHERNNLLIVDDNLINLRILIKLAEKLRCSYATATNGLEAVRLYQSASETKPFSCIFMDISMPVMNGFIATREIRAFEKKSGSSPAYIVALTGLGDAVNQEEAFASGMDLFLTKPVSLQRLKTLLIGTKKN
jgi:CheY-like chemotaxis protein